MSESLSWHTLPERSRRFSRMAAFFHVYENERLIFSDFFRTGPPRLVSKQIMLVINPGRRLTRISFCQACIETKHQHHLADTKLYCLTFFFAFLKYSTWSFIPVVRSLYVVSGCASFIELRRKYVHNCSMFGMFYLVFLPAGSAAGSSAGISFTHGPILGFFAPQGRHVARTLLPAKFDLDRFRGGGLRPPKLKKKFEFSQYNCP